MTDWQPGLYLKYKNERTQPSIDLVNRIGVQNPARIIDIGCGPGNSTAILKERWQNADVYGLDNSASMIAKAKEDYPQMHWLQMGAGEDLSALGQFDVVFSNAALQWMPNHNTLIPNLYGLLRGNGVLAVQVPFVRHLPVYDNIQTLITTEKWKVYYTNPPVYPKHYPYGHYYTVLSGLTDAVEMWQTDYIHIMPNHESIVAWYQGSGLRPFLDLLPNPALQTEFCKDYYRLITETYQAEKDGKILFPFTRVFFLAYK